MLQRISRTQFLSVLLLMIIQTVVISGTALYLSGALKERTQQKSMYQQTVTVGGISVGGLNTEEAEAKIEKVLGEVQKKGTLQIMMEKQSFPIPLKDIQIKYNVPSSLREAQRTSEELTGVWGMWKKWRGTSPSPYLPLYVTFNEEKLTAIINEIARNVNRPAEPAQARVSGTSISILPEKAGYVVDIPGTISAIREQLQEEVQISRVSLVVEKDIPQITKESLKDIKVMLADYSTPIASTPNRLFNAEQAAKFLNGVVLLPSQTFSFFEKAGPFTEAKGYISTSVQNDEDAQDGVMGGAIQVASTLYIATAKSGLSIIERHNNVRPIASIPLGYDAFVRDKELDLRFVNRSKQPVYIYAEVKDTQLRVALFGAKAIANGSIEVKEGNKIAPETIVRSDKSLGPGQEKIIRRGKEGVRVKVFLTHSNEEGVPKRELLSDDYYKPLHNIVAFGPIPENMKNKAQQQTTNPPESESSVASEPSQDKAPNSTDKQQEQPSNPQKKRNVYIF